MIWRGVSWMPFSNQHRTFVKQSDNRTTKFAQHFIAHRSCKQLNAAGERLFH